MNYILLVETLQDMSLEKLYELQMQYQRKYWSLRRNKRYYGKCLGMINAQIKKNVLQPPWV
jgi:hypothetical protein